MAEPNDSESTDGSRDSMTDYRHAVQVWAWLVVYLVRYAEQRREEQL